jgi:hypothetical protein
MWEAAENTCNNPLSTSNYARAGWKKRHIFSILYIRKMQNVVEVITEQLSNYKQQYYRLMHPDASR